MNFFKHNLLSILVCLSLCAAYASATTLTRPYGSTDYAGGQKAVGSKVNTEFDTIVNWLNGGNISSTYIATGGIATANIASFAITNAKLATSTLTVTSSSSVYTTTSNVPATVTNLSTTYTSTGRPLAISLEAYPGTYVLGGVNTYASGVLPISSGTNASAGSLFFVKDSSTTAHFPLFNMLTSGVVGGATAYNAIPYQCADFKYTETGLTSGVTYTFELKASAYSGSSDGVSVINCRLVVREVL